MNDMHFSVVLDKMRNVRFSYLGRMAIVFLIFSGASCPWPAPARTAYYKVCPGPSPTGCGSPNDFVVALTKRVQIQAAERILSGKTTDEVHVQGTVVPHPAWYNKPWKFHLAPKSITFFTFAHPICWGYSTSELNAGLDKIGTPNFLPARYWCPRGYRISERFLSN
jgi:hypothetical protein